MKNLNLFFLFILFAHFSNAEIIYVHIMGPGYACPGTTNTYYIDSDQGGGEVTWVVTNAQILDPRTQIWKTVISYTIGDSDGYSKSQLFDVKFNSSGSSARINVNLKNGPFNVNSELNLTFGLTDPGPMSGSNLICNGLEKKYSIGSVPIYNAESYTWEVPNSNWEVDGTPGPVVVTDDRYFANIKAPSYGSGDAIIKVKAVSPTCGSSSYASKTVRYGVPDNAKLDIRQDYGFGLCVGEGSQFFAEYSGIDYSYISEYSWSLPSGWIQNYVTSDGLMTIITPTWSGNATIGLKAKNTCGYSPYYYEGFIAEDCGYFLSVFPNPADKGYFEVEVISDQADAIDTELNTESTKITLEEQEEYQIKLYSDKMELVLELKTKEKKVQIDTRKLLKGTYFLHFSGDKGTVQRKVVVQ